MAEIFPTRTLPFDLPALPEDDHSFTLSKLKAASESLRCFNDALLRIGEAESETGERTNDPIRPSPSPIGG